MTRFTRLPLLASMLLLAACQGGSAGEESHGAAAPGVAATEPQDSHAAGEHGEGEAQPLRVIMQQLGSDMAGLAHALWVSDTAQLLVRSEAIAAHPNLLASEVERIHGILGAEMPGFEAADEKVHHAAELLHEAVRSGQGPDVIVERLADVQRGCVACHSQYRERLRTDRP